MPARGSNAACAPEGGSIGRVSQRGLAARASGAIPASALGYPGPSGRPPERAHSGLRSYAGAQPRLCFAP
jgi:hypothetical protein